MLLWKVEDKIAEFIFKFIFFLNCGIFYVSNV